MMHHVPRTRLTAPAVAGQLERGLGSTRGNSVEWLCQVSSVAWWGVAFRPVFDKPDDPAALDLKEGDRFSGLCSVGNGDMCDDFGR